MKPFFNKSVFLILLFCTVNESCKKLFFNLPSMNETFIIFNKSVFFNYVVF